MEQLKVGINDLQSVVKKKVVVAAASVLSMEAFLMVGLALQLEMPTAAATSVPGRKVGEECWNSGLDGRLEAVAASIQLQAMEASIQLDAAVMTTSEATWLWETLSMASRVLDPYENHIT
jgi:hypothetical protein